MAVTKIWSHRRRSARNNTDNDVRKSVSDGIYYAVNPEKTTQEGITRVLTAEIDDMGVNVVKSIMDGIFYAENEAKTVRAKTVEENCFANEDDCRFVTGINCIGGKEAIGQFVEAKEFWSNLDPEITHMHAIQSFVGHECTPEVAHQIGVELANKLWGDRFQVLVCTHLNTENVHNHFIINATSFVDGKRFYRNDSMYGKMREESDILCQKYGLDVMKPGKPMHGKSYYYKELERNGAPTRLAIAKAAIDLAIEHSSSLEEMKQFLEAHDYRCDFSPYHKHWTIQSLGWEKPVRLSRLEREYGDAYSKEGIYDRLTEEKVNIKKKDSTEVEYRKYRRFHVRINGNLHNHWILASGYRGYYLHYLYLLGVLPKKRVRYNARYAAMLNWMVRDDLINIQSILDEAKMLNQNKIQTEEELQDYQAVQENEIENLQTELKKKGLTSEERNVLKKKIRNCRTQIRMCGMVRRRTEKIKSMGTDKKMTATIDSTEMKQRRKMDL